MNVCRYRIRVVICYYGNFPWYFQYFLHSCKFNPTIDFIIFSDIKYEYELPRNVVIIKKSLEEIKELARRKLGFEVCIDFPYKLCDFKPVYGLFFSEYLQGYDFWGQSDIDNIYGNIRNFMTDEILSKTEFISVRHEYATGCFALYKNNELVNNIFKRSKDYRKVFTSSSYLGFDEFNFLHHSLIDGKTVFDIETEIETFTQIIKSAESRNEIRALFDFILLEGVPGRIKFDNGRIIYNNTYEAVLYHLYWLKRVYKPERLPQKIASKYHISPTRIYT